jgi:hypothetical protein
VRFDRHADHKPSGYFALSERSGQNRNFTNFSSFREARRASALLCNPCVLVSCVIVSPKTVDLMRGGHLCALVRLDERLCFFPQLPANCLCRLD